MGNSTGDRLEQVRRKLAMVGTLLLEVTELADDESVDQYLEYAFSDWQSQVQGSLDEVGYVFILASSEKYQQWIVGS